jgi:hypothetical protein
MVEFTGPIRQPTTAPACIAKVTQTLVVLGLVTLAIAKLFCLKEEPACTVTQISPLLAHSHALQNAIGK